MNKYVNFKIAIDGESVNIYIETGGEPVHVVYWTLDEWIEDAESSVPATVNAVHLFHTDPDEILNRVRTVGVPDVSTLLITHEELSKFFDEWGQDHEEICSCLGYDQEGSDDLLIEGYFWHDDKQIWLNKFASGFSKKDQLIADYLRNL